MSTIEEDVARVNAVAEALGAALPHVWVMSWTNKHDDGVMVLATEELARATLITWVTNEQDEFGLGDEELQEWVDEINTGQRTYASDEDRRHYSFEWCEVQHKVST